MRARSRTVTVDDMDVGRKVEKKNLYSDSREEKLTGTYFSEDILFSRDDNRVNLI